MNDAETRVLARTAAVLLVVSAARYGWETRPRPEVLPAGADDLPGLLAESRRLQEDAQVRSRPLGQNETIDPNRATEAELDRLPGVGPATARAIVAARERDGPFSAVDDLLRVSGIGPGTLQRMRPHLGLAPDARVVGRRPAAQSSVPARPAPALPSARPPARPAQAGGAGAGSPLDLNRAAPADLERLPGIGPALAGRIVAERSRRGGFRTVEDLLAVQGIGPAILERVRPLVRVGGG